MTTAERNRQRHQEDLERIKNFRLLDDEFLTKCFEEDPACVQLVLRIVLEKPDLEVTNVRTQVFVENILKRSVRLDVLATDSSGQIINVEVQRADKGAGKRRARYNSSMMDANLLKKGEDFETLPETYVVFITEHDVLKKGLPLYRISKCIWDTGEAFDDGAHILYVNGAYRGDDPVGRLMHDFACSNPAEMHYDVLADRTRFFKESKKGVMTMCRAIEEMRMESWQEGRQEGRQENQLENAKTMLADGALSFEKIAQYAGLPLDTVRRLSEEGVD